MSNHRISMSAPKEPSRPGKPSVSFHVALPQDQNLPTFRFECSALARVPCSVLARFSFPKLSVGPGSATTVHAIVTVPEAAMNEDHFATRGEYEIWPPRQAGHMKSIAVSE